MSITLQTVVEQYLGSKKVAVQFTRRRERLRAGVSMIGGAGS